MSLQTKILSLKLNAALAVKHANGWQRLIDLYGEQKATEFYTHLGLNHLESKSVTWEGLQLSREPKEHEKLAVKGIHQAQESSKEAIATILLDLRAELIADGLKAIKKLKPAEYHELVLSAPEDSRADLRDKLVKIHRHGSRLVVLELGNQGKGYKATTEDEFDTLDLLTDLTDGRVVNDVQSRLIAAAQRFTLLGQAGPALINLVASDMDAGSVAYIDRTAAETAHSVIALGRADEMRQRSDEIGYYEYSALLDVNTCEACAPLDGTTAQEMDDLPEVPLVECLGGAMCRCFIVAIVN